MTRRFALPRRPNQLRGIDFESELNPKQFAAASCGEGPKLVIAGAGTGKTRTLTYRLAWLLSQGLDADRVLLVTFTNKAAREMVERVSHVTGLDAAGLYAGTFHSMGARILRRHGNMFGYSDAFTILDESDQRDLLRLCIADVGVNVERRRFPSPQVLRSMISYAANTRVGLGTMLAERHPRFLDWEGEVVAVATRYAERKRDANAMDYDDLLSLWLRVLSESPELAARYGDQFRAVLVDEYQDTNLIQGEIVEALANANGGNLMVVGDDCQSIYAFRGAHYDNILGFPQRHPEAEVFKLEINYRSTPQILELANACIRCNPGQFQKQLQAQRDSGSSPALVPCNYPEQEAAFVAERTLQLRDEGVPLQQIAVLYRSHAHRLSVETTFLRYDIPYEVRGGLRFFEQAHVKDVTAHLRFAENPRDEVAFRRALLLQSGIGNTTARRAWDLLGQLDSAEALGARLRDEHVVTGPGARARLGWQRFCRVIGNVIENRGLPEHAVRAVIEGGYADLAASQFANHESRLEDLEQLAIFAAQYATVSAFLEELVLLGEMQGQDVQGGGDEDERGVVLSTIHQAKGLEWDIVFLVHMVEGAMPSPRSLDETGGEQEERRIFYVALTRARRELYVSYPIVRPGGFGGALLQQPSRFVQELPEDLLEVWELFEAPPPAASPAPPATPLTRPGRTLPGEYDPNVDVSWSDEDDPQ